MTMATAASTWPTRTADRPQTIRSPATPADSASSSPCCSPSSRGPADAAVIYLMADLFSTALGGGHPSHTWRDTFVGRLPHYRAYRCGDDKWVCLGMLQPDRYWADFCRVIERPELAEDERFKEMGARTIHREECCAIIDEAFAKRPRSEWLRRLKEDAGDFVYTTVNSFDDLPDDPQVVANDYVVEMDHPQHGPTKMVGVPVALSETPGSVRLAAPEQRAGLQRDPRDVDVRGHRNDGHSSGPVRPEGCWSARSSAPSRPSWSPRRRRWRRVGC